MATKKVKRRYSILYITWGHGNRRYYSRPDARGHTDNYDEAIANASKHLGRGSYYFKAYVWDRQEERKRAELRRVQSGIDIKEF